MDKFFPPPAHCTGPRLTSTLGEEPTRDLLNMMGHGNMNFPKIRLGSGAGEEEGLVKERDTHKTWQLKVSKPFKFNLKISKLLMK